MNILIVKSYHKGDTVVWELACELKKLGHNVEVLIPAVSEVIHFFEKCGVKVNIINIRSSLVTQNFLRKRILDIKAILGIRKLFNKFDIVHLNLQRARILGRVANLFRNKPLIVSTIHGADLEKKVMLILEKLTVGLDACTVGISSDVLEYLKEKGVKPRKTAVIYNGIDIQKIDRIQRSFNFLHILIGLPSDIRLIGMVARFYPGNIKGHKIFIKAAAKIHSIQPDLHFVLVGGCPFGDCSFKREVESLISELNMRNYIHILDEAKHEDIPKVMDSIQVLIVPSMVREGFGLVIAEAMARRIPVIGSRIGGIPEVIEEGKTGLLVPPGDPEALARAILQIISNSETAKRMGEAGRARVEKYFTTEIMARNYEKLFYELLSDK